MTAGRILCPPCALADRLASEADPHTCAGPMRLLSGLTGTRRVECECRCRAGRPAASGEPPR